MQFILRNKQSLLFSGENGQKGFLNPIFAALLILLFVITVVYIAYTIGVVNINNFSKKEQSKSLKKITILTSSDTQLAAVEGIKLGLVDYGFRENDNIIIELYNPKGDRELTKKYAAQLANSPVDVLVPVSTTATKVLLEARGDKDIPVVFVDVANIKEVNIEDIKHPGNKITGVTTDTVRFADKRMELLKDVVPKAKVFGILYNSKHVNADEIIEIHENAASKLNVKLKFYSIENQDDLKDILSDVVKDHPDGLLTTTEAIISNNAESIAETMKLAKIPTIDFNAEKGVKSGYLMMLGVPRLDTGKQGARLLAKVLKGEDPGSIPIEYTQDNKLEINPELAKELNISFPESLLIRATTR